MKNLLCLSIFLLMLASCTKSDSESRNDKLLSQWQLSAQLLDPGDGSGVFVDVNSQRIISFYDNGEVTSNASFCTFEVAPGTNDVALYDEIQKVIKPDCGSSDIVIHYEMNGEELILRYQCIEPCLQKYIKLN